MGGFTKFENEILEKILTADFSKRQLKILLLIIRFSFGCQKNYCLLKNKDFTYARVSPYCIKDELEKLVKKGVIKWNLGKEMIWINKNLSEWIVDSSGDNPKAFIKIATKNLPKQQLKIYQNINLGFNEIATPFSQNPNPDKEKEITKENIKENINKNKENILLNIFKSYSSKVSPLNEEDALTLKDLLKSYSPETIEKAISIVSSGNERSLSYFLKVLDDLAFRNRRQAIRLTGLESLGSIFKRANNHKL